LFDLNKEYTELTGEYEYKFPTFKAVPNSLESSQIVTNNLDLSYSLNSSTFYNSCAIVDGDS
jgi:hypothetical protein